MGDQSVTSVLVAGAGPTGLVLAVELAARGVAVRLIDAADQPAGSSRAKGMQPRTIEVLDRIGVGGRVVANGRSRLLIRRHLPDGGTLDHELVGDAAEPDHATPYTRTMIISQARTEEFLRDRLAELGGTVERGSRLISFEQDPTGVSAVVQRAGTTTVIRADYLIGCDGAGSAVRKQSGIEFLGTTGTTPELLTADVRLDGLDRDFWHQWTAGGALMALCPLPGLDAFQMQTAAGPDTPPRPGTADVQALVDQHTGGSGIRVREVLWASVWRSNVRLAERYRDGRVFLAGDAAHVHPPAGGLGLNTSVQDAANLGWKLAHVLAGAPAGLLDTYEQERRPVAADVLGFSRDLFAQGLGQITAAAGQARDVLQLSVSYRTGPPDASGLQPGDRAPDGLVTTGPDRPVRLFDLYRGTHATALAFGPRSGKLADTLAERFPDRLRACTVDAGDETRLTYGVTGDTLLIIRPDGYVGARLSPTDEDEAGRYLDGVMPSPASSGSTESNVAAGRSSVKPR